MILGGALMQRQLISILATDVVGFSRKMEQDEQAALDQLREVRQAIVEPTLLRHSGATVKLMGDGALMTFGSVVDGLTAAVDMQTELARYNARRSEADRLMFRAGLHIGDVIRDGDDIFGDGVNVAARLESIAPPGGILVSKQVHDQIHGTVPVGLVSMGLQELKNIARPIEVFRVELDASPRTQSKDGVIRFGAFEIDVDSFELRENNQRVALEPQAFDLLTLLAKNPGRVVSKDEIFNTIWNDRVVSDAALSSQIKAARRAVGDTGSEQKVIATVHGRGFRFVAPLVPAPPEAPPPPLPEPMPDALEPVARRPSVAVLPFVNMNRDPSEDYLADGVTEDITLALSRNRWLTVVARNPAFSFRNSTEGLRSIGRKLEARYLVTGSIRKAGTRFRITVEIVEAETEHSVWSERFDRDSVDIFDLQDEISEMVAARIEAELGLAEQQKALRTPRQNQGAWELYQLGAAEFYKFTPEANIRAQDYLRQSIKLDETFAAAHARLAYAIILSMIYFDADTDDARMDEALESAKRSIQLDDQDANGYFTIGRVHLARKEYGLAIEALEHARELNPCYALTYCGLGDSLAYEGRLDEALAQFDNAIRLSPHDPFRWAFYSYRSLTHLFRKDYDEAANWARRSIRVPNAQYWAWAHLVAATGYQGKHDDIDAARADLLKRKPAFTIAFARERMFYLKLPGQLEAYLEGLRRAGVPEGEA
jgi:TolB-like protein/class 3 adenylate cyclase/Tfp pilus assembly protein PilF